MTLIERLEKAGEGSREMDELVALATTHTYGVYEVDWDGFPAYTTSVDCALALAEKVLPPDHDFSPQTPSVGWKINLYRGMIPTDQRGGWFANVRRHATDGFEGASESPALALCIAILRALPNYQEKNNVG